MMTTRITLLLDNTPAPPSTRNDGLVSEGGLAMWIEHRDRRILFDGGLSSAAADNAARLGIDLSTADAVVLSHGHYDHTGGLAHILPCLDDTPFYAHPEAFEPRYSLNRAGPARDVGMPASVKALISQRCRVVDITGPMEITEGVLATGPIPRLTDFEDTGGRFYRDAACRLPDTLNDDQALMIENGKGVIVCLGCAHAGVINTLRYVETLTGGRPVTTLIGGMHLINADAGRLDATIAALEALAIRELMPCHCTGETAMARMLREFPDTCRLPCCGSVLEF